jgi:hypothetical protein
MLGNPVQRGHRFQRKADSNPVIADSRWWRRRNRSGRQSNQLIGLPGNQEVTDAGGESVDEEDT